MFTQAIALAGLCAVASAAVPNFGRAVCNRDNCLRAVSPRSATCASFLQTTVVLCPATTTTTFTTTVPATVTEFATLSVTTETTDFLTVTTGETTSTTITEGPITVTSTVFTTSLTVETATTTIIRGPGPAKRFAAEPLVRLPIPNAVLNRRQVTCTATTTTNALPSGVASCSGSSRYSSACACLGYTATTITIPASTSTVSETSTVTATTTISTTETDVATSFTTSTIIETSTTTESTTTTLVSSETVSTAGTTTTSIEIVATETPATGPFGLTFGNGQYVNEADTNTPIRPRTPGQGPAVSSESLLGKRASGDYNPLILEENSQFVYNPGFSGTPLYLTIANDPTGFDVVVYQRDPPTSHRLACAIADPVNLTGRFSCSVNGAPEQSSFYTCGEDSLLYIASAAPTDATCVLRTSDFSAFPGSSSTNTD